MPVSWPVSGPGRAVDGVGDREEGKDRPRAGLGRRGRVSCVPRLRRSWPADFFTVDRLDGTTAHVLTMIEHATRRIHVLGATAHPTAQWTAQMARNALMDLAEQAGRFRFLIRDHGPQFTSGFDAVFHGADIRIVTTGIQAPVMNAIQERRLRSVRAELLDRTLVWNLARLRRVLAEYESFYNGHRPHRALGQAAPLRPLPDNHRPRPLPRRSTRPDWGNPP